nr:hypothetical protein [Tanacetum cinerariifolium]
MELLHLRMFCIDVMLKLLFIMLQKEGYNRWESYHGHGGRAQLKWIHNHLQDGVTWEDKLKDTSVRDSLLKRTWLLIASPKSRLLIVQHLELSSHSSRSRHSAL